MSPSEIKEETKKVANSIINKFQVYGFWCILILGIGVLGGIKYCNITRAGNINDSIKLGNFLHEGKVYEVKERIVIK